MMGDDEQQNDDQEPRDDQETGDDEKDQKDEIRPVEDETTSDEKTCPECGVPIYNLRKNCPNCGYEYSDDDYDEKDVGSEFTAGSEVPEEEIGEKVKEDVSGEEKTAPSDEESADKADDSDDEDAD